MTGLLSSRSLAHRLETGAEGQLLEVTRRSEGTGKTPVCWVLELRVWGIRNGWNRVIWC